MCLRTFSQNRLSFVSQKCTKLHDKLAMTMGKNDSNPQEQKGDEQDAGKLIGAPNTIKGKQPTQEA